MAEAEAAAVRVTFKPGTKAARRHRESKAEKRGSGESKSLENGIFLTGICTSSWGSPASLPVFGAQRGKGIPRSRFNFKLLFLLL